MLKLVPFKPQYPYTVLSVTQEKESKLVIDFYYRLNERINSYLCCAVVICGKNPVVFATAASTLNSD